MSSFLSPYCHHTINDRIITHVLLLSFLLPPLFHRSALLLMAGSAAAVAGSTCTNGCNTTIFKSGANFSFYCCNGASFYAGLTQTQPGCLGSNAASSANLGYQFNESTCTVRVCVLLLGWEREGLWHVGLQRPPP